MNARVSSVAHPTEPRSYRVRLPRRLLTLAVVILALVAGTATLQAQDNSIAGRVRALGTNEPLAGVQLSVLVPADFVWNITASNTNSRRQNRVFQENHAGITPSSSIGIRYRAATYTSDPRIPITNTGKFSNSTNVPLWVQSKYPAVNSPIPMATGTEMQLLIAEADRTSNRANTLAIIAKMRTAGNQPAYTGTTAADDLNEIIDQRRRALFLTGTQFGDVIRYNLTLTPAAGAGTPWSQQYGPDKGSQLCLPLPQAELLNNPFAG